MQDIDSIVFKKKKFSDILEEIHSRSQERQKQITGLVEQLKGLIGNLADAMVIVPHIKSYMDLNLQNDDLLVKMAGIIQKCLDKGESTGDFTFTDKDREDILKLADELDKTAIENPPEIKKIKNKS